MKQFRHYHFFILTFILSLFIVGCEDEDSPTTPAQKPTAPQVSFNGPNTNSTNQYAQQAKSTSQLFNSQGEMFNAFAQLPGTQNGNVWSYTITANGLTETITSELLSDGSYQWKIVLHGLYTDEGKTVNVTNWTAFEGTTSANGKSGSWKIYETNSTAVSLELIWATDAAGNETGSIKMYSGGVLQEQLDIVNNIDGTGSLTFFQKGTGTAVYKSMEITWIADGTGTYKIYNAAGAITSQGTF